MKTKYKLDTGLSKVIEEPEFDNDEDAWEYLRKLLPNKFAVLFKLVFYEVPLNNKENYVLCYNQKYTNKIEMKDTKTLKVWIPVLEGITSDKYEK